MESADAQSQADSVDVDGMSLSPVLPQFDSLELPSPIAYIGPVEDSATGSVADDSVMADDANLTDSCSYDEDDSDFELDDLEDSVRGVQQAADHVSHHFLGLFEYLLYIRTPSGLGPHWGMASPTSGTRPARVSRVPLHPICFLFEPLGIDIRPVPFCMRPKTQRFT